jgi:RNA polymerase sigma factor (TIGR02999 family)
MSPANPEPLSGDDSMPDEDPPDDDPITEALRAWEIEGPEGLQKVMPLVYSRLLSLSRRQLIGERTDHTLTPTALVHEVYLRLVKRRKVKWQSRIPFFAFSAKVMRQVLVDHARARRAQKRPDRADRSYVDLLALPNEPDPGAILRIDDALKRIEQVKPQLARYVELHFFSGLSQDEIAEAMNLSRATVQRLWEKGKPMLAVLLKQDAASDPME